MAAPTSDTMIGDGSSVVISQPVPTLAIQAPISATSVAVHTVRNAGTASGLHADGDGPSFLFVRDLFRKPVPTFRDHALCSPPRDALLLAAMRLERSQSR